MDINAILKAKNKYTAIYYTTPIYTFCFDLKPKHVFLPSEKVWIGYSSKKGTTNTCLVFNNELSVMVFNSTRCEKTSKMFSKMADFKYATDDILVPANAAIVSVHVMTFTNITMWVTPTLLTLIIPH